MNANTTAITPPTPRVWAVMSYRAGENSQILALTKAIGWQYDIKKLTYHRRRCSAALLRQTGLSGIDLERSSPLQPPWPDVVISAGLRNEPVCRWIKEQSDGKTRLVQLGRTWAALDCFDLVVTTPQYRLPNRPNVLRNQTCLQHVDTQLAATKTSAEKPPFLALPPPYIAVIAGGNSGPFPFGAKSAALLARQASAMANSLNGTLLVSTSARTSKKAADALFNNLHAPAHTFRWQAHCDQNPYFAYLAFADAIIVTSDSIAMLSEACATRKPVYMFNLGDNGIAINKTDSQQCIPAGTHKDFHLTTFLYRQLMRLGPTRLTRDIGQVHQWLINSGRAVWLGQTFPNHTPPPLDDMQRAVSRVRALVKTPTSSTHANEAEIKNTPLQRDAVNTFLSS